MSEIIVTFGLISTRISLKVSQIFVLTRQHYLGTNPLPHQDRHYCYFFRSRISVASDFYKLWIQLGTLSYFSQQGGYPLQLSTHHPITHATSTQEYPDCIYSHINISRAQSTV